MVKGSIQRSDRIVKRARLTDIKLVKGFGLANKGGSGQLGRRSLPIRALRRILLKVRARSQYGSAVSTFPFYEPVPVVIIYGYEKISHSFIVYRMYHTTYIRRSGSAVAHSLEVFQVTQHMV